MFKKISRDCCKKNEEAALEAQDENKNLQLNLGKKNAEVESNQENKVEKAEARKEKKDSNLKPEKNNLRVICKLTMQKLKKPARNSSWK